MLDMCVCSSGKGKGGKSSFPTHSLSLSLAFIRTQREGYRRWQIMCSFAPPLSLAPLHPRSSPNGRGGKAGLASPPPRLPLCGPLTGPCSPSPPLRTLLGGVPRFPHRAISHFRRCVKNKCEYIFPLLPEHRAHFLSLPLPSSPLGCSTRFCKAFCHTTLPTGFFVSFFRFYLSLSPNHRCRCTIYILPSLTNSPLIFYSYWYPCYW